MVIGHDRNNGSQPWFTLGFHWGILKHADVWTPHPEIHGGMGDFKIFPRDSNAYPTLRTFD